MKLQKLRNFQETIIKEDNYMADYLPQVYMSLLDSNLDFSNLSDENSKKIVNLLIETMENINNFESKANEDKIELDVFYESKNIFNEAFLQYLIENPKVVEMWPANESGNKSTTMKLIITIMMNSM